MSMNDVNAFEVSCNHTQSQSRRPVVWSIAGSDSGGGAGIQADLRAFERFGVHGCTAIAAITAQNSLAVERIEPVSAHILDAQLAALAQDMPPVAIKTGMLATVENVEVVVKWVDQLRKDAQNAPVALVVDPICRASTGAQLASEALRQAIIKDLIPRASLIKPNVKEAIWLVTGEDVSSIQKSHLESNLDIPQLASALRHMGAQAVVITGGDVACHEFEENGTAWGNDWLDTPYTCGWLGLPYIQSTHTHGTGCTFTASAASAMALGFCTADAIILAKMATTSAVQQGYAVGQGAGVVSIAADFAVQPDLIPFLRFTLGQSIEPFEPLINEWMGLYPIVDSADWVKRVIDAGAKTVQLRIKSDDPRLNDPDFLSAEIKRSITYAQAANIQFYVNDHWQLVLEHGAYGVHLGQEDIFTADLNALRKARVRLGISTNSLWEMCIARAVAPSYIACGPVYSTQSKELPWLNQGPSNLAYWCKVLREPVVAIAGINVERSTQVVRCGAKGVAVISAITLANHPEQAIEQFQHAINQGLSLPPYPVPNLPHHTLDC